MGSKETLRRKVAEVVDRRIIKVNGRIDVLQIPGKIEQQFFRYLHDQFSDQAVSVAYEPHSFKVYDRNGSAETTTPDFLVEKSDGTRFYIEITTRELNGKDPKGSPKTHNVLFPRN